jgi:hypothetical protein
MAVKSCTQGPDTSFDPFPVISRRVLLLNLNETRDMTTLHNPLHPETLPPDPTPPGRSVDFLLNSRGEVCNTKTVAQARELLAVIKGLVERLEEHLEELQ